jgi:vacuolar-type H+-ATPase subunit E/Vma4
MSLESILNHIITEANSQKEKIIQEARLQAEGIMQSAKQEAERIYKEILDKEKSVYEKQKQKLIVQARLQGKKNLLGAKQELIDEVFEKLKLSLGKNKFKKEQVSQDKVHEVSEDTDFYLKKIRPDYEVEIAALLFK